MNKLTKQTKTNQL